MSRRGQPTYPDEINNSSLLLSDNSIKLETASKKYCWLIELVLIFAAHFSVFHFNKIDDKVRFPEKENQFVDIM